MASGGQDDEPSKRSVVVDQTAFEEQFLRCAICREKFEQNARPPKSLPCNHTFCLPCLKQVFDVHQQATRRSFAWADDALEGALKCPTCRVEIYISRSEIGALPNYHRVIQMIDFLSRATTKAQNVCPKHEHQALNFFCKLCLQPVCRDCTVLDHKEQQGHEIVDISEVLNQFTSDFDTIQTTGKELIGKLKHRSDCLANASKRLDLLQRQIRSDIKDTFIEYRLLLEKRQEGLIKSLSEMVKEQKALINTQFAEVCSHGTCQQSMFESFIKARETSDVKQLFKIHQEMKATETKNQEMADVDDAELYQSFSFDALTEGQFLADMSGLGELHKQPDASLKEPVPRHQLFILENEQRPLQWLDTSEMTLSGSDCEEIMEGLDEDREVERFLSDDVEQIAERIVERAQSSDRVSVASTAERLARRVAAASAAVQAIQAVHPPNNNNNQSPTGTRSSRRVHGYRVVRHQPGRASEYSSSRYSGNRDSS